MPSFFPENQGLANFVRNQRYKFKNLFSGGKKTSSIQRDEFKMLQDLGLSFSIRSKTEKSQMFDLIVDRVGTFKEKHEALWRTGDFNNDSSNLPSDFQDLQTLCEDIKDLKLSKARKKVLKRLRVSLTESIGTLPASMEGGKKSNMSFEVDSLSEVFEKKILGKETQEIHDALEDDSIGEIIGKEIVGTRPASMEGGKTSNISFGDDSISEVFEKKILGKETQEKHDALEDDSIGEIIGKERGNKNYISFGEIVGKEHQEKNDSFEGKDEKKEELTKLCFQEDGPIQVRRSTRSTRKEDGPIQVRRSTRSTRNNHSSFQEKGKETSNLCQLNGKKVHFKEEIPNKVRRNTRSMKK